MGDVLKIRMINISWLFNNNLINNEIVITRMLIVCFVKKRVSFELMKNYKFYLCKWKR